MLHLYFNEPWTYDDVLTEENYRISPALWFDNQGGASYIGGDLEKQIIKDIDKSEVMGQVLLHPLFGAYPPSKLSGTTKTLILMHNEPNYYYNGNFLGENACPWIIKMSEEEGLDLYIRMAYIMPFCSKFKAHIVNDNSYTTTFDEYVYKACIFHC